MQREPCSGRAEEDVLASGHDHKPADGNRRIHQFAENAVPHLPAQNAPGGPERYQAAGDGIDQFVVHGGLPPPNRWRMRAQRSAALMARLIAARSEPPKVPSKKPTPATMFGSVTPR